MRRREFITLLGGAVASSAYWPPEGRAQQPTMPVVGFLGIGYLAPLKSLVSAFRKGLEEAGYSRART
jgi:putative ABC transport system substrate-binding protein